MIVKILTHLYLEKWENFWKNQGILSVKKSGNPDYICGMYIGISPLYRHVNHFDWHICPIW